jgi:hypothetical protein
MAQLTSVSMGLGKFYLGLDLYQRILIDLLQEYFLELCEGLVAFVGSPNLVSKSVVSAPLYVVSAPLSLMTTCFPS